MIHWLQTAFSTYVLHPLRGSGYQFWSGSGSDLAYAGAILAAWRHVNCEKKRCWRAGHRHPEHGRPVCRKHFHHDIAPPRST